MTLRDCLYFIKENADVCVIIDKKIKTGEASDLLGFYCDDEDLVVEEIVPNGYTDAAGLSYLTIYAEYPKKCEEELPFK